MDIEELYLRNGPMVLRRCRQLLADEEEARDAMQDVFVQLLRRQGRMAVEYPASLLYRMATNVCLNRIRSRQRRPETPDEELLAQIADADDAESRLTAGSLLAKLFGKHQESTRTMAVMHYLDKMTYEEIAAQVGMSVSGVRKRLRVLRASLHDLLDEDGGLP